MDKTQERNQESVSDNYKSTDDSEFRPKKHFQGAVSWFVCIVLTLFCYFETKIPAMLGLLPLLFILGLGFLRESGRTVVKIDNDKMIINDYSSFAFKSQEIDIKDINSLNLDITSEGKTEVIHSITVVTKSLSMLLPDIDNKEGLKEKLLKMNPSVKIKSV